MRIPITAILSLSVPGLIFSEANDLTEREGRWYSQSYWQKSEIQQDYTFTAFKGDHVSGDSSVKVRMRVSKAKPRNSVELRLEPKKPFDLSEAEALEISLKVLKGTLKPSSVFLCNPGFKKLTIAKWPGKLQLPVGEWKKATIDLTEATVLDKAKPGVDGEYDRKDVATVCLNFTLPDGEVDNELLIDGFKITQLPPPPVTRKQNDYGSFEITSKHYSATVSRHGYLQSIRAGKTEFIKQMPVPVADGADTKSTTASGFFSNNRIASGLLIHNPIETVGRAGLRAKGKNSSLHYVFREHDFDITVQQSFTRAGQLQFVLSSQVVAALDGRTDLMLSAKEFESGSQIDTRLVTNTGGALLCRQYVDGYSRMSLGKGNGHWMFRFLSYGAGRNKITLRPVGTPLATEAIGFKIESPDPDFLFPGGQPVQFRIHGTNYSSETVTGKFRFQVCDYLTREPLKEKETPFQLKAGETAAVPSDLSLEKPGTYRARVIVEDGRNQRSVECVFVYDFPDFKPELTRSEDFSEFWKDTLSELSRIPMDAKIEPVPEAGTKNSDAFKVSLAVLGGRRVHCWYWRPKAPGRYPARFELPSSGVYPRQALHVPHAANYCGMWIAIHGLPVDYDPKNPPKDPAAWNYWTHGIDSPKTSMWRTIYASLVRGMDFLCSRKEVDPKRIMVSGGSQGGGLTMVLAGLDQRVSFAAPAHSGLPRLDWTVLHGPGFWPFRMQAKPAGQSQGRFLKTLSYFDAANFTPDIRCPVVAEVSLLDTVTASGNQICALAHLKPGQLELICDPWHSHSSSPRGSRLRGEAVQRWMKGEPPVKNPAK